jgi:hypothetical protein
MKSLLGNITEYFNKRTKHKDLKSDQVEKQVRFIENGEIASRLLKNTDFALMFNLYRFSLMERMEDAKTDLDRIRDAHYISGARDFIDFIELTVYLSVNAQANIDKKN